MLWTHLAQLPGPSAIATHCFIAFARMASFTSRPASPGSDFLLPWKCTTENTWKMYSELTPDLSFVVVHNGCPATGQLSVCSWTVQATVWQGADRQCPLLSHLPLHLPVTCPSWCQGWHWEWNRTGKTPLLLLPNPTLFLSGSLSSGWAHEKKNETWERFSPELLHQENSFFNSII